MWKIVLVANVVLMILFVIAGQIVTAPAYNHFVRYPAQANLALPSLTQMAIDLRKVVISLPMLWAVVAAIVYQAIKLEEAARQNEKLLAFTAVTLVVGLLFVICFGLAGILPYLRIGAAIQ